MGNGEAKQFICMTHGHEVSWGNDGGRGCTGQRGINVRKTRKTVIAWSIKYLKIK